MLGNDRNLSNRTRNRRRYAFGILSMTSITSRSTRSRYSIRKDYSLYFFWSSSNSIQWAGSRSFILVASVFLNSSSFAVCKETRKAINSRCSFEGNRATSSFNCVKDITGRLAGFYRRPKVFEITPRSGVRNDIRPEREHRERSMECNPEGLSVLGYPILSDSEHERGQGAGGGELATASPSSGGQRVWSGIQRSEDRGQSAQANAEGKWRLEL